MAIAIDRGKATIATVRPAIASARRRAPSYPSVKTLTIFGTRVSVIGWAFGQKSSVRWIPGGACKTAMIIELA
ncbi:hypothetical protein D3C87_2089890 [compost metagenome]